MRVYSRGSEWRKWDLHVHTASSYVLSKVFVEDILDENGLSLGENIGSKKAYAQVVLDNVQRDRVYVASQYGRLLYELYCDSTQKPPTEDFLIPTDELGEERQIRPRKKRANTAQSMY